MRTKSIALATTGVCLLLSAGVASAQTSNSGNGNVETVVVTGSILPQTSLYTPAPVTFISSLDIKNSGLTTVTDVLRSIDANNAGSLPNAFGLAFATGASNISLRGLQSSRTLVLINGERTVDYALADDGIHSFVDLNTIPQDAIDHIEVLKDGASSIYGADAVAGVVNIIMKKDFQGLEASAEWGDSQHGGGQMERLTARLGYGDLDRDRFNAYIDVEFEHDNNIKAGERPFPFNQYAGFGFGDTTAIGGLNFNGGPGAVNFTPGMSASVAPALIQDFTVNNNNGNILGPSQPISAGFGIPGACGNGSTLGMNNPNNKFGGSYCFANESFHFLEQPQSDRYNVYAHVTAKLWPGAMGTIDASYNESDSVAPNFWQTPQATIPNNAGSLSLPAYLANGNANPNDPFVFGNPLCAQTGQTEAANHSATCPDAAIAFTFPERNFTSTQSHVLRTTANIKGDYEGWTYDLDLVAAHTWLYEQNYGFLSLPQELAAVNNGTYNFVNPNSNSQALINQIAPPILTVSTNDLELIDGHVFRELFQLPGGPLEAGLGATVRHEQAFAPNSNPLLQQNLGFAQTIGSRNVYSTYVDISAPIFTTLEVEASGRFDHYTDAGDTVNPKLAAKWTPIEQISLRGTYSTGFVAPSFAQSGANSVTQGFVSPFSIQNNVPPALSASFIAAHGGDAYVTQSYSLGNETAGNPSIKPEKASSYTLGTILTPFEDINLTATIDYYWIRVASVIAQPSIGNAIGAFFGGTPLPAGTTIQFDAPDPLHPTAPLRPVNIIGTYSNGNKFITDGVDLNVRASTDLPYGINWTSNFDVTEVLDFWYYQPGAPRQGWVGTMSPTLVNAGDGTPRWIGNWSNTFTYDKFSTTFTAYYHSGLFMNQQDAFNTTACTALFSTDGNCKAKSFYDIDMTMRYELDDRIELFGTIKNLLDYKPPVNVLGAGIDYNSGYDQAGIIGRFFQAGVHVRL